MQRVEKARLSLRGGAADVAIYLKMF